MEEPGSRPAGGGAAPIAAMEAPAAPQARRPVPAARRSGPQGAAPPASPAPAGATPSVPDPGGAAEARLPGEPYTFPGHEPATLPRPEVEPDRWPREEPDTVVAPSEVVEPAVYPRPEPATPAQPRREPDGGPGAPDPDARDTGLTGLDRAMETGRAGQPGAAAAPGVAAAAELAGVAVATGPAGTAPEAAPTEIAPAGTAAGTIAPARTAAGTEPGEVFLSRVRIGPHAFERIVVRTHWFQRGEDLAAVLRRYLAPHLRPGDHAIVSETAVIAVRGRMIPAHQVRPGALATLLARYVRPTGWGQGLSVPHKMQVAIEETGRLRILAAAAAAAVTRPLGIRGVFYHVAGPGARSLDGMRAGSPYEGYVLPPLRRAEALAIARELAEALGAPVHIVDINDNGGTIRASSHPFPWRLLLAILRDNPLGQGDRRCPIGLIRPWEGSFGLLGDE